MIVLYRWSTEADFDGEGIIFAFNLSSVFVKAAFLDEELKSEEAF